LKTKRIIEETTQKYYYGLYKELYY